MQNRLKSKVFWATLVTQIVAMMAFLGVFEKLGIAVAQVEQVIAIVLQLAVTFGLLNNPTDPNGF